MLYSKTEKSQFYCISYHFLKENGTSVFAYFREIVSSPSGLCIVHQWLMWEWADRTDGKGGRWSRIPQWCDLIIVISNWDMGCYYLLARVLPVSICHLVTLMRIWMPFQVRRYMVSLHHEHRFPCCLVGKRLWYTTVRQGCTRNGGHKGHLILKTTGFGISVFHSPLSLRNECLCYAVGRPNARLPCWHWWWPLTDREAPNPY